jgi:hypothetical protein
MTTSAIAQSQNSTGCSTRFSVPVSGSSNLPRTTPRSAIPRKTTAASRPMIRHPECSPTGLALWLSALPAGTGTVQSLPLRLPRS